MTCVCLFREKELFEQSWQESILVIKRSGAKRESSTFDLSYRGSYQIKEREEKNWTSGQRLFLSVIVN